MRIYWIVLDNVPKMTNYRYYDQFEQLLDKLLNTNFPHLPDADTSTRTIPRPLGPLNTSGETKCQNATKTHQIKCQNTCKNTCQSVGMSHIMSEWRSIKGSNYILWRFPKIGVPPKWWFIMENTTISWMIWGCDISGNLHCFSWSQVPQFRPPGDQQIEKTSA
jgi:hypothetical protein